MHMQQQHATGGEAAGASPCHVLDAADPTMLLRILPYTTYASHASHDSFDLGPLFLPAYDHINIRLLFSCTITFAMNCRFGSFATFRYIV